MDDYHDIPIKRLAAKTYIFQAEIEQDEDGRWSAWIEALPGAALFGATPNEDALETLQEAAQAYLAVLVEKERRIPAAKTIGTTESQIVAVTL